MSANETAISVAAHNKNGGTAETGRRGQTNMLQVAEKPEKAKLLTKVGSEFITASPDKKAAEWLEGHIAKSQDRITTVVGDLTPALARVLMSRNDGNRKVSDNVMLGYARDMKNGGWHFNGEPIIVAADGRLNDGQHRCLAVIDADTAIPTIFVFGVARETRTTLDQGRVRTAGDFLAMSGYAYTNQIAAIANAIWQHTNYKTLSAGGRNKATKGEIVRMVEDHPNIVKSLNKIMVPGAHAVGGYSVLGFCHWTFARAGGVAAADAFMEALTTGAGLSRRDPILYVRNRLINERGKLRINSRAELIFKAWNAWRTGASAQRFEISGGQLPKVEK